MAGADFSRKWPSSAELIDASARSLLKKGLARMPELQTLSAEEALAVVKEAEILAAAEQDVSFYAKATSVRFALPFAGLLLLACLLAVGLWFGVGFALSEWGMGRRRISGLMSVVVVAAYCLFVKLYRQRTPHRMRPYVRRVLEKRKEANVTLAEPPPG